MLHFLYKMCIFLGGIFSYFLLKIFTWLSTSTVARNGITFSYKTIIYHLHYLNYLAIKLRGKLFMKQSFIIEPMKFIKAYYHIGFYDNFILWFTLSCEIRGFLFHHYVTSEVTYGTEVQFYIDTQSNRIQTEQIMKWKTRKWYSGFFCKIQQ